MLYQTSFNEFSALAKQSQRVVVSREIYGDMLTPVRVFRSLVTTPQEAVLLDSSDHATSEDACIYIGLQPIAEFSSFGNKITIRANHEEQFLIGDTYEELKKFYYSNRCYSTHKLSKFAGGMIGYMSYDAVRLFEEVPDRHENKNQVPDLSFKFYATNIVFDKRSGKVTIAKLALIDENDLEKCYQNCIDEISSLVLQMNSDRSKHAKYEASQVQDLVNTTIRDEDFCNLVEQAKQYIHSGDAFQIVLSREFTTEFYGDDFDIYRALRVLNPSPYQFYIRQKDFTIVGSSPERLVKVQGDIVETIPIAGTRKRGNTIEKDNQIENELLRDEKELAEHIMLVDLARNDIGLVCEPGSVEVCEFKSIHKFSRVMHIISRVKGKLIKKYDLFDILRFCFPAGTLSGAPKIRAMEIIDELETSRRGIYGGAICAIDHAGQLDSCITIRTALVKNNIASVRAGAGIVLDSQPQKEADETRYKSQSVFDAIALAKEGLV